MIKRALSVNPICILLIMAFLVLGAVLLNKPKTSAIIYFAKLKQISTSGETRFQWYDSKLKRVTEPDDQYSWFWAMPDNVPNDQETTKDWVKKINDNQDLVFKITGVREKDDCDYYDSQHCIQSVKVKSIEIVK